MSPPRVRRSRLAAADLLDIWLHIARENEDAADRLLDRIEETCRRLAQSPALGRSRDELSPGLRSFPVGRYVLFYRPRKDRKGETAGIELARVLHGSRDLDLLF